MGWRIFGQSGIFDPEPYGIGTEKSACRKWSRFLPVDGQPGSNPQVLINALTGNLGTRIHPITGGGGRYN